MQNLAQSNAFVLAADVGGTKTHIGLFSQSGSRPLVHLVETYPSGDARGLAEIIERFLALFKDQAPSIVGACIGIAGPVRNGRCKTTNLPWEVSEADLKARFGWPRVRLINDLTAASLSLAVLEEAELETLSPGLDTTEGNKGLIAPGTGLGMGLLIRRNGTFMPTPSEGGHMDFAPQSEAEIDLWRHLNRRLGGHVSVERILSGPGLVALYTWLRDSGRGEEPSWLGEKMARHDPARVISETALRQEAPLCVQALEHFVSILGATAGNLALVGMTTSGLYIGGGIAPKILPFLKDGRFLGAFTAKGRFRELLASIPVRVILNDRAALVGAAVCIFSEISG